MARRSQAKPDYTFLAALDQPIRRPRTRPFYALGLTLAAVVTLILPLIYLLFIAGVAWVTYYHAAHSWGVLMGTGTGRILVFKFLLYLAPLLAGAVVLFFRVGFARSGMFASHPSPADRIRRARMAGAPGLVII